ncbi:hypothetical protein [Deinococcus hopiensis]|uniref:Uncharacterized protein n=1 Tax=Deinococcus hopiensis KR-140 TaxID=695939 RepID=A0A1W1UZE9_9DEIO|nr:hypothetical protein [Deinococcus hopiensis]SMB86380.1 hypothetical protein SAMN00790413_03790 [Deinococcus hopiensis KR-140]
MNDALTAPALRSFDLVHWGVENSFVRVQVRGPHDLTNQLLKVTGVTGRLSWDEAHELACAAWASGLPQDLRGVSMEVSWG